MKIFGIEGYKDEWQNYDDLDGKFFNLMGFCWHRRYDLLFLSFVFLIDILLLQTFADIYQKVWKAFFDLFTLHITTICFLLDKTVIWMILGFDFYDMIFLVIIRQTFLGQEVFKSFMSRQDSGFYIVFYA